MNKSIIVLISCFFFSSCAIVKHKEEIGVLRDLGKDADRQDDLLKQESEAFENLKDAIHETNIAPGMKAMEILKIAGEPVIASRDKEFLKWSYKPGHQTWLKGEAIHLYFDHNNELVDYSCVRFNC